MEEYKEEPHHIKQSKRFNSNVNLLTSELYIDFIKRNLDKDLRWSDISKHKLITWKIVSENPNLPWCYYGLSEN